MGRKTQTPEEVAQSTIRDLSKEITKTVKNVNVPAEKTFLENIKHQLDANDDSVDNRLNQLKTMQDRYAKIGLGETCDDYMARANAALVSLDILQKNETLLSTDAQMPTLGEKTPSKEQSSPPQCK